MDSLNLALIGYGKMGQRIERLAQQDPTQKCAIVARFGRQSRESLDDCIKKADVVVDFSSPSLCASVIRAAVHHKKPLLVGTTGLTAEHEAIVVEAAPQIPICMAPNTSLGIAALVELSHRLSGVLGPSYDIEIHETHHREKKDAPSGTALMMGKATAQARGMELGEAMTYPHTHKRTPGSIGFSVSRGGSIFGEHTVRFLGDDEVIELSHKALSRDLFARGALTLVQKLVSRVPGLYTAQNLLGIAN